MQVQIACHVISTRNKLHDSSYIILHTNYNINKHVKHSNLISFHLTILVTFQSEKYILQLSSHVEI